MCQLTFSDLKKWNKLFLLLQGSINTRLYNKDGFGLFNGSTINKSELAFDNVINKGEILKNWVSGVSPVIFHVRAATPVNGKKNISVDSSHPFESENFILAHNGVLEYKEQIVTEEKVDSLLFLKELEKEYTGDLVTALQKAYNKFYGTFAFLVYEKGTKNYFAVRGKTKKLHYAKVGELGYVLNTDEADLISGLNHFKQFYELYNNEVEIEKPVLLDEGGIYLLQEKAQKVGEIVENSKPAAIIVKEKWYGEDDYINYSRGSSSYFPRTGEKDIKSNQTIEKVKRIVITNKLNPFEMDLIAFLLFQKGLIECGERDLESILDLLYKLVSHNTSKKSSLWEDIKFYSLSSQEEILDIYKEHGLKFPFMLNKTKVLEKLASTLKTQYREGL